MFDEEGKLYSEYDGGIYEIKNGHIVQVGNFIMDDLQSIDEDETEIIIVNKTR